MRRLPILCLIAGLLLAGWLIFNVSRRAIFDALGAAGWSGLLVISAFHLMATALMGIAWWRLQRTSACWLYIWGRLLRDAGSELLPLSQVGGYVLGARAPILCGLQRARVAASVIVDITIEFCSQLAFIALGLGFAMRLSLAPSLAAATLIALVFATAMAIAFVAVQIRHHDLLTYATTRLSKGRLAALSRGAFAVQSEIRRIYRARREVWQSFALHLAAWIATGAETWLALRLMGISPGVVVVLVIESFLSAARSLSFFVPGAIGVQDGAYLVLGTALGVPPEAALALSMLRRERDLVLGVPALLSWQIVEGRRWASLRADVKLRRNAQRC